MTTRDPERYVFAECKAKFHSFCGVWCAAIIDGVERAKAVHCACPCHHKPATHRRELNR